MFLYNIRYRWSIPETAAPHGVILNASGINYESVLRRESRVGLPTFILFDPQLYLTGLDVETSPLSCARLASYPYFPVDVPEFRSDETTLQDWIAHLNGIIHERWSPELPTTDEEIRRRIRQAIELQIRLETSHFILPVPLIEGPDTSLDLIMRWVDIGHEEYSAASSRAKRGSLPLVTVAISERLLHAQAPSDNPILQGIIDHLTSREEIRGIYLLIEKSPDAHERITSMNVAWSVLHICHVFGIIRGLEVFINFAEQLGLLAIASGARGFGSGYENKGQRCCLLDFAERGGGWTLPHFYSLSTFCEYLPERDLLEKILPARLLRIFNTDEQPASANLFSALRSGAEPRRLPVDWAETRNNVRAAQAHYNQRIRSATEELLSLASHADKVGRALVWIQQAEQNNAYFASRFETDPLSDMGIHTGVWRQAFERYGEEFGLI